MLTAVVEHDEGRHVVLFEKRTCGIDTAGEWHFRECLGPGGIASGHGAAGDTSRRWCAECWVDEMVNAGTRVLPRT